MATHPFELAKTKECSEARITSKTSVPLLGSDLMAKSNCDSPKSGSGGSKEEQESEIDLVKMNDAQTAF